MELDEENIVKPLAIASGFVVYIPTPYLYIRETPDILSYNQCPDSRHWFV